MHLTAELVARTIRTEDDPGPGPGARLLMDSDFERLADNLLLELGDAPLWIFAYGSLLWKPVFEPMESRPAIAWGFHRSFCIPMTRWRGSPDAPGLMMGLQPGGRCRGLALRIADGDRRSQLVDLLRREIDTHDCLDYVRWVQCRADGERMTALTFWVSPKGEFLSHEQSPEAVAAVLARACGHIGSGADYLHRTVQHLDSLGIRDRNLWTLQRLVAEALLAEASGASG